MACIDCSGDGVPIPWSAAEFPLHRCSVCGLVFYADWATDFSDGGDFHPGNVEYYEQMEIDQTAAAFNPINLVRTREVLDRLARSAPTKTLLDVGCGRGEAVAAASQGGWRAEGVDLAPGAIRIARSHGLHCSTTDFFDRSLDDRRFGVIVMSEFIEHVPRPSKFLERAHELLEPDGLIYVTTPNFASFGRRRLGASWSAIGPGHVAYFDRRSLLRKAEAAGLVHVSTRTGGVSVAALRSFAGRSSSDHGCVSKQEQYEATEQARETLYGSRAGRAAKRLLDPVVGLSGLGETLKTVFRRGDGP